MTDRVHVANLGGVHPHGRGDLRAGDGGRAAWTVWALPWRLSALSGSHSKSFLCRAFLWARRVLNSPKRRFPGRAEAASAHFEDNFWESIRVEWCGHSAQPRNAYRYCRVPLMLAAAARKQGVGQRGRRRRGGKRVPLGYPPRGRRRANGGDTGSRPCASARTLLPGRCTCHETNRPPPRKASPAQFATSPRQRL